MIKLIKTQEPDILAHNATRWTKEYLEYLNSGSPKSSEIKKRYNHPTIKEALFKETHDKCAYCESKISHTSFGDIEHIFPKSKRPELYVKWENLTLACEQCNRTGKKDYYDTELPLINPYIDKPEEHFCELGSFIFPIIGDNRAKITIEIIQLNRSALVERRMERIQQINNLLDSWHKEENKVMKRMLHDELVKECQEEKEYSSTVKAFLLAMKFPF